MRITAGALASQLQGELLGDSDRLVIDAQPLHRADAQSIAFLGDETKTGVLADSQAGIVLISRRKAGELSAEQVTARTWIIVGDVLDSFIAVMRLLRPERKRPAIGVSPQAAVASSAVIGSDTNIHPGAVIGEDVIIGAGCEIHPGVVIGTGCRIGDHTTLHPNVVLYADVTVGCRVIIHAGTVLGADGFGYRFRQQRFEKIPQLGTVRIENDVEIGACATIDRGMIGPTVIGEGTKLDNLVMVAHNCELGKHNVIVSQVGFAGSVTTGDFVRCAGKVGVADHVHLGTGCTLGAGTGVHKDIPAGETWVGYPARPHDEAFRIVMAQTRLPEMRQRMRDLEKQLGKLMNEMETLRQSVGEAA